MLGLRVLWRLRQKLLSQSHSGRDSRAAIVFRNLGLGGGSTASSSIRRIHMVILVWSVVAEWSRISIVFFEPVAVDTAQYLPFVWRSMQY